MSTLYTPSPTNSQAPAPVPDPDNYPLLQIPSDGDPDVVASVNQGFKALGDQVAWLKKPRAKTGSHTQPVRQYQNANLDTVDGVDHLGFLGGRTVSMSETFRRQPFLSSPGSGAWGVVGDWKYLIAAANVGIGPSLGVSGSGVPVGPGAQATFTTNGVNAVAVGETALPWIGAGTSFVYDVDISVNASTSLDANTSYAVGLGDGSIVSGALTLPFAAVGGPQPVGCALYTTGGAGATWFGYVKPPSPGTAHSTSTTVVMALDAIIRLRIEVLTAHDSDDGSAHVYFYINGSNPIDMPYDMASPTPALFWPFFRFSSPTAETAAFNIGPPRIRARLHQLNALY